MLRREVTTERVDEKVEECQAVEVVKRFEAILSFIFFVNLYLLNENKIDFQ
jgi:hypothetical protein